MQRIFLLIGIINQLATTRLNRVLGEIDLPMAQFSLLAHYSNSPERGWTVTELARVMEVNQPAMTKTTQRLLKKGYLKMVQEKADKRVKSFYVTENGLKVLLSAWDKLGPDITRIAQEWNSEDLKTLESLLEKLKTQLDEARD
ncbi:MAG: MarR family transcriptional regulator [Proteobacteria bacterium]|nr:MarR family transcriptional regulator [Pseudomonadota bacterium]